MRQDAPGLPVHAYAPAASSLVSCVCTSLMLDGRLTSVRGHPALVGAVWRWVYIGA